MRRSRARLDTMEIEYVPLLRIQRELQGLPRNLARFKQYLRTLSADGKTLDFPTLGVMNPMGREHVTALLDELLALDADAVARRAVSEAAQEVEGAAGSFKMGLVIADDLKGGWTNRWDWEYNLRFPSPQAAPGGGRPRWLKDWWLTAVLWSSEPASAQAVREAVLTAVYRAAYLQREGPPRTLRDMMLQEGQVMAAASCAGPVLDDEDLAYTREVVAPFLGAGDKRTAIECLFGDPAGRTLGFTPRGLSAWAGLALALHDAARPAGR